MLQVIEPVGIYDQSFSDAVRQCVSEASRTIRGISGVKVVARTANVADGRMTRVPRDVSRRVPGRARRLAGLPDRVRRTAGAACSAPARAPGSELPGRCASYREGRLTGMRSEVRFSPDPSEGGPLESGRDEGIPMAGSRILIVDDHPSFRAAAGAARAEGYEVVGEAEDGMTRPRRGARAASRHRPARRAAPRHRRLRGRRALCATRLAPPIVLTSSREASDYGPARRRSGACGFVPKAELGEVAPRRRSRISCAA